MSIARFSPPVCSPQAATIPLPSVQPAAPWFPSRCRSVPARAALPCPCRRRSPTPRLRRMCRTPGGKRHPRPHLHKAPCRRRSYRYPALHRDPASAPSPRCPERSCLRESSPSRVSSPRRESSLGRWGDRSLMTAAWVTAAARRVAARRVAAHRIAACRAAARRVVATEPVAMLVVPGETAAASAIVGMARPSTCCGSFAGKRCRRC
jgi:hypothetical protein